MAINLKEFSLFKRFVKFLIKIAPILFITVMCFLVISSLRLKSFTIDEGNYLDSGEILAKSLNWDHYVTRFHPPLTFYYHGLLTLFDVIKSGGNKLYYARLMMVPILIIFSLLIYFTAKKNYGRNAGLLAMFLFCFDPNILAHGRLIATDVTLAMFIFLFLILFFSFLKTKEMIFRKAYLTGVVLGLALLTKYNALMLFPLSFFFFCTYFLIQIVKKQKLEFLKKALSLFLIYLLAILIVNLGYGFKSSFNLPDNFKTEIFQNLASYKIASKLITVFPGIYLTGTDYQMFESQREFYWMFFWGQRFSQGPWYFFPVSFLIKVPIPALILLFLFFIFLIRKRIKRTFFEFYFSFSCLFFFLYFTFFNKLITGFRYILMIFPILYVLISQIVNIKIESKKKNNVFKILLTILLFWYIWGALKIHPHYLAYVNEFVGGPKNAYKYYADSNLDWGQNWILLNQFKEKNTEEIIDDPKRPTQGKIIVSVNSLNLFNFEKYEWLRKLEKEPIGNIGYTWLIFEVTNEDIQKLK
ncbi:ArnT family glycosyltransferase [Patescibacteria group bacterium]